MKKTLKFLSLLALALISAFAMLAFAACNDGGDGGDGGDNTGDEGYFVIYAQLEDGTKVGTLDGVQLQAQWCISGDANGACSTPTAFDANGKARISIVALKNTTHGESFDAHIFNLPAGYEYDEGSDAYVVSESKTVVTITIRQA